MRKALTVATTGGQGYMKRCPDNMRSVLCCCLTDFKQGFLLTESCELKQRILICIKKGLPEWSLAAPITDAIPFQKKHL